MCSSPAMFPILPYKNVHSTIRSHERVECIGMNLQITQHKLSLPGRQSNVVGIHILDNASKVGSQCSQCVTYITNKHCNMLSRACIVFKPAAAVLMTLDTNLKHQNPVSLLTQQEGKRQEAQQQRIGASLQEPLCVYVATHHDVMYI